MNKKNNKMKILLAITTGMLLVGCGNLSVVSEEGTTSKPVFPNIEKHTFNHDGNQTGSWVNWDNLRQIEKGMNKSQIYQLIGKPHHSEGLYGVREWDYTFNYNEYSTDGKKEFKQCQYKILFDKDMNVGETYWFPNGCNGYSSYKLESDFLFDFNSYKLNKDGEKELEKIAKKIIEYKADEIEISGHTDRFGTEEYNLNLSEKRAASIAEKLHELGVNANFIIQGYGEMMPIKTCTGETKATKDCLKPNRRVEIKTMGRTKIETDGKAGKIGPYPYYEKTYPQIINQ